MTDWRAGGAIGVDRVGWGWLLAYGIASIVIGVLAFLNPVVATLAATVTIGLALAVVGAFACAAGWLGRGVESRAYTVVLGIVSLLIGLWMAMVPVSGAVSLTLLVGIWLFARGLIELGLGSRYRRHRTAMIVLGIVNILLALYVLFTLPWSALTLPGFILGISFLSGGIVACAQALSHRPARVAHA